MTDRTLNLHDALLSNGQLITELHALKTEHTRLKAAHKRLLESVKAASGAGEPVAYLLDGTQLVEFYKQAYHTGQEWTPLYTTHPAAVAPVALTDEQIDALWVVTPQHPDGHEFVDFARAVEAAHGIVAQKGGE